MCASAITFACSCLCVCVCVCSSHLRNPSTSHLWRPQQSQKQAPPPAASQQPVGGLVWDYLGTWVAGGPCQLARDHCTLRLTLPVKESDMKARKYQPPMWKSDISNASYDLAKRPMFIFRAFCRFTATLVNVFYWDFVWLTQTNIAKVVFCVCVGVGWGVSTSFASLVMDTFSPILLWRVDYIYNHILSQ